MDVAYAGSRVPTEREIVIMRLVAARATYTMSKPSSTDAEHDSCTSLARSLR
jgi:hypothetical protein